MYCSLRFRYPGNNSRNNRIRRTRPAPAPSSAALSAISMTPVTRTKSTRTVSPAHEHRDDEKTIVRRYSRTRRTLGFRFRHDKVLRRLIFFAAIVRPAPRCSLSVRNNNTVFARRRVLAPSTRASGRGCGRGGRKTTTGGINSLHFPRHPITYTRRYEFIADRGSVRGIRY